VLDPTTMDDAGLGGAPLDLAPRISAGTRLLHLYEFRRAQRLSAAALALARESGAGGDALRALFEQVDDGLKFLPSVLPEQALGALALRGDGGLAFGVLQQVHPKPGWRAPFLHRCDAWSTFALQPFDVDAATGLAMPSAGAEPFWFHPCDFVCSVAVDWLAPRAPEARRRGRASQAPEAGAALRLRAEGLLRWREMWDLLGGPERHGPEAGRGEWADGVPEGAWLVHENSPTDHRNP